MSSVVWLSPGGQEEGGAGGLFSPDWLQTFRLSASSGASTEQALNNPSLPSSQCQCQCLAVSVCVSVGIKV